MRSNSFSDESLVLSASTCPHQVADLRDVARGRRGRVGLPPAACARLLARGRLQTTLPAAHAGGQPGEERVPESGGEGTRFAVGTSGRAGTIGTAEGGERAGGEEGNQKDGNQVGGS